MSSTSSPRPPSAGRADAVRTVTAAGRTLRVSVREGSDPDVPAPTKLGGELETLADAPGTYVFDK